jgi:tetratricopeptide (TPR) repeat protein
MKLWLFIATLLLTAVSASPQTPPKKSPQPKGSPNAPSEWSLRGRLDANPHDEETHKKLCALLEGRGDIRALVKERWTWLGDNPGDWFELAQLMVEAEIRLYDPEYAITAAKRYLSNSNLTPEDIAGASGDLARLLVKRGRTAEAISYFEATTKAKPDIAEFWADLGDALVRTGRIDAGIEALRKAIDLDSSFPRFHAQLGDALAAKGDLAGQETEYKAACNLDKNDPLLANQRASRFVALAKLQISHSELGEAAANLDKALQLDPNGLYAYLVRAQLLEKKGQIPEAQAERKKAESVVTEQMKKEKKSSFVPSHPLAIFAENDPQETVRILEVSKEHLTSIERMMLALAYFDLGRRDEGLAQLDKFFEDPKFNTAQAHFTFAEALKKARLNQEAEEHYRKAYEMDPENTTYRYEYETLRRANTSRN